MAGLLSSYACLACSGGSPLARPATLRSLSSVTSSALCKPRAAQSGGRLQARDGTATAAAALAVGGGLALQCAGRGRRRRQAGAGGHGALARGLGAVVRGAASSSRAVPVACKASDHDVAVPQRVPVVLLSGFLGTGKTTLLKHWLENAEGRIGIVVNDVAAVNIDSKLVQQSKYGSDGKIDAIQLQNGCACCSLGDELLITIYDLLELATDGEPFSQIVVELSGVAEPQRVRENFLQAEKAGSNVVDGCELSKVVTLLDASTFCSDYMEWSSLMDREDLMEGDMGENADCQVVELLVEQTEAADIVVLNKSDLATAEQLDATRAVVSALNTKARVLETSFGKVALSTVLAAPQMEAEPKVESEHGHSDHGHAEHGHAEHAHEEHGHAHSSDCSEPSCTDASHGHGHSHAADCSDASCTDESHGHSHSHVADCSDPSCTDESHGHEQGHSHSHSSVATTAEERFGITSFTYTARRPFHELRFTEALKKWPVPKQDDLGLLLSEPAADGKHPLSKVVRSKGFCWLETHPSSRMYWSHAGKDMKLNYEGLWWGAMTQGQVKCMENMAAGEYDRARREDWSEDWADRRQEIVFIGQRVDEAAIRSLLDECLLTDEELVAYKKKQDEDRKDLNQMWVDEQESYKQYG